uniref:CCHC-type domain-containing protein n=1 Tax=Strigamia maritima TaxID=126957 RepID=T1IMZ5_STRMM
MEFPSVKEAGRIASRLNGTHVHEDVDDTLDDNSDNINNGQSFKDRFDQLSTDVGNLTNILQSLVQNQALGAAAFGACPAALIAPQVSATTVNVPQVSKPSSFDFQKAASMKITAATSFTPACDESLAGLVNSCLFDVTYEQRVEIQTKALVPENLKFLDPPKCEGVFVSKLKPELKIQNKASLKLQSTLLKIGVNPNNSSDNSALSTNQKNPRKKPNNEVICFNSGIKGHYSNDCRKKPKKEVKCSNCGILGHYGTSCRKGKSKGNVSDSVSFSHFSDFLIIDGLNVSTTDNEWIWDTKSGAHLCHDRNLFTELTIGKPYKMNAYSDTFDVEGIGTVCFNHMIGNEIHQITLNKVGYAPSGKHNLISGSRAMQAGGQVVR